jgi:hypothetical protein
MEGAVYAKTFGPKACLPRSMSNVSYNRLLHASFLLIQWLTTRIYGGPQPPTVYGGPPGVNPAAINHLADEPEPAQTTFARTQAQVQAQYDCKPHAGA